MIPPNTTDLHRGVSFGFMAPNGYFASDEAEAQVDRMAALNVDSVALMVMVMQEAFYSTRMFRDFRFTADDGQLLAMIERIRAAGMRVMLKPVLECHDSVWRGNINFPAGDEQIQGVRTDYWGPWFESLGDSLVHYGRLAERGGAEMLCLGCEYRGAERRSEDWATVVQRVREVYGGTVTYNAAGYHALDPDDLPTWYGKLDVLGLSYYVGAEAAPEADALVSALLPTVARLAAVAAAVDKPLVFAEAGCRSVQGGQRHPAKYDHQGDYDGDVQANWLEAVWRLFHDQPWWHGMFWWKWDEQQDRPQYHQPGGDTGFTIAGKPAADAMKRCYGAT